MTKKFETSSSSLNKQAPNPIASSIKKRLLQEDVAVNLDDVVVDDVVVGDAMSSWQVAQADLATATSSGVAESGGAAGAAGAGAGAAGMTAAAAASASSASFAGLAGLTSMAGGVSSGGLIAGLGLGVGIAANGSSAGVANKTLTNNAVAGTVVAGPVIAGNDLKVVLYKADGKTELTKGTIKSDGTYLFDIGTYTGVVIAKLEDLSTNPDYMDEATGQPKDLTGDLMATGIATQGTVYIDLNVLTTVAARKASVVYTNLGATALASDLSVTAVNENNAAVASAFGLKSLHTSAGGITTTVDKDGAANTQFTPAQLSEAEKYGAILAALSGVDSANTGNMQTTIDDLVSGLTVTGSTGALSTTALGDLITGARTAAVSAVVSQITEKTSDKVSIDRIGSDAVISATESTSAITGTNEAGATVALAIGANTRTATITGTTWSYTLNSADITAMGDGGETITATATLNGTTSVAKQTIAVDTTTPTFVSAASSDEGKKIILTYSEALSATVADKAAFDVLKGGVADAVTAVAVKGKTVELILTNAIANGDTVTVAYRDLTSGNDANVSQDVAGNDVATLTATAVDTAVPTWVSATESNGTLVLTYSEALDATSKAAANDFVVKSGVSGSEAINAVTDVSVSGSTVVLTLTTVLAAGDSVKVSYNDPSTGNDLKATQDSVGKDAASLTETSFSIPSGPPVRNIVVAGAGVWEDSDRDGVKDARESFYSINGSKKLVDAQSTVVDFSTDTVTIRFVDITKGAVDVTGFNADDKIKVDLVAGASNFMGMATYLAPMHLMYDPAKAVKQFANAPRPANDDYGPVLQYGATRFSFSSTSATLYYGQRIQADGATGRTHSMYVGTVWINGVRGAGLGATPRDQIYYDPPGGYGAGVVAAYVAKQMIFVQGLPTLQSGQLEFIHP